MHEPANLKDMIIVRLLGGLGNQMFQYAFGRSLSVLHGHELRLDLNFYKNQHSKWALRTYALDHFMVKPRFASEEDLRPFRKYLQPNLLSRFLRRASLLVPARLKSYIFEPLGRNFTFDPELLGIKFSETVYFDGFWQTEKYFKNIENLIRKDFEFSEAPNEPNRKILAEISAVNSVAIHIRHGDNATKLAAHQGVLPIEYYHQSINELTKVINNPYFYIFSDDINWAKANLKLDYPTIFVNHNGEEKHFEDLRLMAACKHHIIGNSTFSWWGAYLGKKPGQRVYAPSRYHMHVNIPMNDYYPLGWKIINL